MPNEAETELLEQIGNVDAAVVEAWCKIQQCLQSELLLIQFRFSHTQSLSSSSLPDSEAAYEAWGYADCPSSNPPGALQDQETQDRKAFHTPLARTGQLTVKASNECWTFEHC